MILSFVPGPWAPVLVSMFLSEASLILVCVQLDSFHSTFSCELTTFAALHWMIGTGGTLHGSIGLIPPKLSTGLFART